MSIFKKVAKKAYKKVIKPAVKKTGAAPYVKAGVKVVTMPYTGIRDVTKELQRAKPRKRRGR